MAPLAILTKEGFNQALTESVVEVLRELWSGDG